MKSLNDLREHAIKRFHERLGYCLTYDELDEIENLIEEGHARIVIEDSSTQVFKVYWKYYVFHVVYAPKRASIITFLTLDMDISATKRHSRISLRDIRREKRAKIWEQNRICFVCLKTIETYQDCTLEHIIPLSLGGTDEDSNLSISHKRCNQLKGNLVHRHLWEQKLNESISVQSCT